VDAEVSRKLASDLRQAGVDVWFAEWELKPGDSLRRKIDEGIDRASHFLVLLSPASIKSEWVQIELDAAMVLRISGKCRLIPVLLNVEQDSIPATLRGLVWASLRSYDDGLRQIISVCHDVSRKPPLGRVPNWASERPLPDSGMSPLAQRLAAELNRGSESGWGYDMVGCDALLTALDMTPEELGIAASELDEWGWVKLHRTMGDGPARFGTLQPRVQLFVETDEVLRGWNPVEDAATLAAAMINDAAGGSHASIPRVAQGLGWPPRRLNPAADYLAERGYIRALRTMGSAPYVFTNAAVDFKTRRFAESQ